MLSNIIISYIYLEGFLPFFSKDTGSVMSYQAWIVTYLLSAVTIFSSRILANYIFSKKKHEKVVIYGAGSAGIQLAGALRVSIEIEAVSFVVKNPSLQNKYIGGIKVLPPNKLEKLIQKRRVDEVLIAIPSSSRSNLKNLLKEIEQFSIKVRILPGLAELAQGKVLVSELKEVDVSDLLGRLEVSPDQKLLDRNILKKSVLITGAGGSIGSEISRQVIKSNPSKLVLLDANEYALFN